MKHEHIKIMGDTIFWVFFIMYLLMVAICVITRTPQIELIMLKDICAALELLGVSIEIAAIRIKRKELKESEGKSDGQGK